MTVTSNGKEIVWVVCDNDGYECSNFVGVFDSEDSANEAAERIRGLNRKFYAEQMGGRQWNGWVSVGSAVIGEYKLPPDATSAQASGKGK